MTPSPDFHQSHQLTRSKLGLKNLTPMMMWYAKTLTNSAILARVGQKSTVVEVQAASVGARSVKEPGMRDRYPQQPKEHRASEAVAVIGQLECFKLVAVAVGWASLEKEVPALQSL
jgi:hypothetical protein